MEGHVRTRSPAPHCIYYHNISPTTECGKKVRWMLREVLWWQPEVEVFAVIYRNESHRTTEAILRPSQLVTFTGGKAFLSNYQLKFKSQKWFMFSHRSSYTSTFFTSRCFKSCILSLFTQKSNTFFFLTGHDEWCGWLETPGLYFHVPCHPITSNW